MQAITLPLRTLGSGAMVASLLLPLGTCQGCDGKTAEVRATDFWDLTALLVLPALLLGARFVWQQHWGLLSAFDFSAALFALAVLVHHTFFLKAAIGYYIAAGGIALVLIAGIIDMIAIVAFRRRGG
jgi:hypothetical protein